MLMLMFMFFIQLAYKFAFDFELLDFSSIFSIFSFRRLLKHDTFY